MLPPTHYISIMQRPWLLPLVLLAVILAAPLLLRDRAATVTAAADPLVIVTPHNEAIRHEFTRAFRAHYRAATGRDVAIDWRSPGGTSELVRHLVGEYTAAFRRQWEPQGHPWSTAVQSACLDRKLRADSAPPELWAARQAFLNSSVTSGIDLMFGGGQFDCQRLADQGILVPCGLRTRHPEWFAGPDAPFLAAAGGEVWYDPADRYYGACLTTFGLCYNPDRLRTLKLPPPAAWRDLTAPAYAGQLALGDPSKSGSIAKCYEMMLQQVMAETVARRGTATEAAAVAQGWDDGLLLIRCLCANARYFTNSAGKVTADVATGDAAAGICIDSYGRVQQEWNQGGLAGGNVVYVTPAGGTSVSADPIALLRGAPHADTARRFLDFVLSPAGQRLWDYRVGTPGGPERYALRRLPIRRDLYTPADRAQMSDGAEDPFAVAGAFTYHGAWTGPHFNLMRLLIRVMGVDGHPELREAWNAICDAGGPEHVPQAMAAFRALPFPYAEAGAAGQRVAGNAQAVAQAREWSAFFRTQYQKAHDLARAGK